ncbi:MAG: DsbA family protein [Candidatus Paceibacterota bacterium]|nr:MAG: DsbA family protein [Candidatus Paceibacterota bacterium]
MKKNNAFLWVGFGVFIIASVFGIIFLGAKTDKSSGLVSREPQPISASDWINGEMSAEVVIIEYSDFECPACASYFPILKDLKEKFGSQIAVVYRHFPLTQIHRNAELASLASEAAGRQGKFWEMHDLLFENQRNWSANFGAKEIFIGYAQQLQLDEEQFINDLDAKDLQDKVSASYREGVSIGIAGTPTFFLNGEKISNPRGYEEFERVISEKLNQ